MAMTTVIMIVLSIAVLTVLVIFFNSQTGFLSKWFRTNAQQSNIDTVVSSCGSLVTSNSAYSYCCEDKEVIFENETHVKFTCDEFRESPFSSDRIPELSCESITCAKS